jgi:glutamyl-tRNA synthetase
VTVVTRFPPSPTGDLHIGGARTALFNWAFARHHGGLFLLRFEDTDRERSTRASEIAMLEALEWLGLDADPVPGPTPIPRQSERGPRYAEAVERLLATGHAYRCVCSADDLEEKRRRALAEGRNPVYDGSCRGRGIGPDSPVPFCVRLAVPDAGGRTRWDDAIAGPSGEDPAQIGDFVIVRSDGTPIYHLAAVVDDHDMGITHVIRGREHMTSTPRQLLLYQALGFEPPFFAHVPLLVGEGGKKLSKRQEDVSVLSYRDRGFLPEAVVNFIARLGWGSGDLEVFDRDELVRRFTLEGIGKSPSQVPEEKLLWLSQHYLKRVQAARLHQEVAPFLAREAGHEVSIDAGLAKLLDLLRERSQTLADMARQARFALVDDVEPDPKAAAKHLKPEVAPALAALRDRLAALPAWDEAALESAFGAVVEATGLALGKLAQPVRVSVVGSAASPGIYETLGALGRERTLRRLEATLARLAPAAPSAR